MKSDSLRFRVCIWDFDGTLFDSYPVMNRAMMEALQALGQPRPFEEVRRLMKQSVSTALGFYREHFSLGEELGSEFRRREKLLSDDLPPYDGALELCRDITEAGGMNLLYTHRDSVSETMLQRHGFAPFIHHRGAGVAGWGGDGDWAGGLDARGPPGPRCGGDAAGARRSLTSWKDEDAGSGACGAPRTCGRQRARRREVVPRVAGATEEIEGKARAGQTVDALASGGDEGRDKLR